ncbi:PadR family transcriptional regulator [Actinotalea sp. AC32]|nr:PadR family transcriptional regulator [Actinotalea sp. AC32]
MAKEATTRYAVLGMLTLEPMTGYGLREAIAGTIGHFWHESFGQLYPALRALEAEGLVSTHPLGPRSREHRITDRGRAELRRWLGTPPSSAAAHRSELLLKVFFARHAEPGAVAGLVRAHRDTLVAARERYGGLEREIASDASPDGPHWLATVRHGIAMVDAGIAWSEETLRTLTAEGAR